MIREFAPGYAIAPPDDWRVDHDPSPEVSLVALAPPDPAGFSRSVVVTVGPISPEWRDAAKWQRTACEAIITALDDAHLIDSEVQQSGFRQLISYIAERRALTLEQWATIWPAEEGVARAGETPIAITVSATTPTLNYPDHASEMCDIAWSVSPITEEAS